MTPRQPRFDVDEADLPSAEPASLGDGHGPSQLVTCLVIDLAESNAVLERLGEGRGDASRSAYPTLLRNALVAQHGRELSRRDDRVLAAFDVPTEAVACAVAVVRSAERHNRRQAGRLDVRVGIQIGEADEAALTSERGDLIARPAIQAAQLCAAAADGQILVSDLVAVLTRADLSIRFERAGLLDIAEATDPLPTFEVVHRELPSDRPPLPPGLAARPSGRCSFVGRGAEREHLLRLWAAAADGERRLVFALGEPGIGKSRLAAEFAAEAHADGAVVLSGRSFEESIVPYQPFVEALRQYVADCDPAGLEAQLSPDPTALLTLVPELAARIPSPATRETNEGDRYRLFDAVAALLSTISVSSPVLLVLDDLQWADPATLLLLKHIALDPRPASMLILGLYRDTEVGMSHPLTQLQADVERDLAIDRVSLAGLADADVASMLDEMIGWSPPSAVARGLREETEGNPFFLQEVIHQLDESGITTDRERLLRGHLVSGGLEVPDRVRDFVARRLQRLAPAALEILGAAAIVGTEFSLDVLARVLVADPSRLVDDLEEAVEARLVIEIPGRAGTYAFTHALFQQTLHDRHGSNRRASLHARVADAIETLHPDDPSALSDLARHYALTAGRYAEKVVLYGAAAGDRAFAQLAYEDALQEYGRALDALPLVASADELTKADLLVRLGEAQTRVGDAAAAKRSFLAAAEHCVDEGSSSILARAALGYGGTGKFGGIFDSFQVVNETLVGLLERAIEACPHDEQATRVRLLGRLAQALYWSDDRERMLTLSQEALDSARCIGDPTVIAHALHSRHVALWHPDHLPQIRAAAEEMLALGESEGDRDIQLKAYTWLITDALETDPFEVVDQYVAGYVGLAEELHRPYLLGYADAIRAARAHLEGRFDEMARLMGAQLAHTDGAYARRAKEAHRWQLGLLLLDIGRVDDALIVELSERAARHPGPTFRAMLALAYATVDRRDEAAAELAGLANGDLGSIARDCMWAATLAMLARVVSRLEAVEHARSLYDLLAPYADRNCLWGSGFMILGPISRYLGRLATTFGEPDQALAHLEHALGRCHELGSPPLIARTKVSMARALSRRGLEGDEARARILLAEASRSASEMGMPGLADSCRQVFAEIGPRVSEAPAR